MDQQPFYLEPDDAFTKAIDNLISEIVELDKVMCKIAGLSAKITVNNLCDTLLSLKKNLPVVQLQLGPHPDLPDLNVLQNTSIRVILALSQIPGISSKSRLYFGMFSVHARLQVALQPYINRPIGSISPMEINELRILLSLSFKEMQPFLRSFVAEMTRSIEIQAVENQKYSNLTLIATFLSGVTASVLQIVGSTNLESGDSALGIAVSTCLFSSLVVSTASAALSLLAVIWIQTIVYKSSGDRADTLWTQVYVWLLRQGPLTTILVAGVLFTLGLVLFMFASHQHHVTSIMTTSFAGLLSFGILILASVLFFDSWKFKKELKVMMGNQLEGILGDDPLEF